MLVSLEIKNFLLIRKISINFINGFNAFTGETGAGKSIIIEGLKLALGGKNQTSLNLKDNEIDGLIVIGGDGSFTGALKLQQEFNFPYELFFLKDFPNCKWRNI